MITLNHNIIFSKIVQIPHVSESESSDEQGLMTDHATLSASSKVSEHSNEDFVNQFTVLHTYS